MSPRRPLRLRRRPRLGRRPHRHHDRPGLRHLRRTSPSRMGPFAGYETNREPMLRVIEKHRAAAYDIDADARPRLPASPRRSAAWDEALDAGRAARLPQLAGHGHRPDGHDQLHDGLRHHRHRAGHRAGQVQDAGRRRPDEDRQQHRARARCARLGYDERADRRRSSPTSTTDGTIEGAPGTVARSTCPSSTAPSRPQNGVAHDPLAGPRQDDGRRPALHLRRHLQDR